MYRIFRPAFIAALKHVKNIEPIKQRTLIQKNKKVFKKSRKPEAQE